MTIRGGAMERGAKIACAICNVWRVPPQTWVAYVGQAGNRAQSSRGISVGETAARRGSRLRCYDLNTNRPTSLMRSGRASRGWSAAIAPPSAPPPKAGQRADNHHDHTGHEEVGEQKAADNPGHRACEQPLADTRRPQFLRVLNA